MNAKKVIQHYVIAFITLSLLCGAASAQLQPREIIYLAGTGSITAGEINVSLRRNAGGWEITADTEARGIGRLFSGKIEAMERALLMPTRNGSLETVSYMQRASGRKPRQWQRQRGSGNNSAGGQASPGAWLDRLGLQLELANQLARGRRSGQLAYFDSRGRPRSFQWQVGGDETIRTGSGEIRALRVERVDGDNRVISWHTPALNFLPARVDYHEDGSLKGRMTLKHQRAL